jgi:hypothetical protein
MSARKPTEKKVPPTVKQRPMAESQVSRRATPKVRDCLGNRQQLNKKQQQLNNSTKTSTITELLLQFDCCCVCFLFNCFSSNAVVFVSCSIVVIVVSCSIIFAIVYFLTRPGQGPANLALRLGRPYQLGLHIDTHGTLRGLSDWPTPKNCIGALLP